MKNLDIQPCIRCGCGLKVPGGITMTGDQAIAVYIECLTVGFRPRARSGKQRDAICVNCAVSMAFGPPPSDGGTFNMHIYQMLHEIVRDHKSIVDAAHSHLGSPDQALRLMPGSQRDKTLEAPALKAAALR